MMSSLHSGTMRSRVTCYVLYSLLLLTVALARSSSTTTPTTSSSKILNVRDESALCTRGGYTDGADSSSAGEIDDIELDEYIEFLLEAAERTVSEHENPLYKRFQQLANDIEPTIIEEESRGNGDERTRILQQTEVEQLAEPLPEVLSEHVVTVPDSSPQEMEIPVESDNIESQVSEILLEETIETGALADQPTESGGIVTEAIVHASPSGDESISNVAIDAVYQDLQGAETPEDSGKDQELLEDNAVEDLPQVDSRVLQEESTDSRDNAIVSEILLDDVAPKEVVQKLEDDAVFVAGSRTEASTTSTEVNESGLGEDFVEKSSLTLDNDEDNTKPVEASAIEFFLGPSAVGESPAILEEVALVVDDASSGSEIQSGIDNQEAPLDAQSGRKEAGVFTNAMKTWGRLTASLVGVDRTNQNAPEPENAVRVTQEMYGEQNENVSLAVQTGVQKEATAVNVTKFVDPTQEDTEVPIEKGLVDIHTTPPVVEVPIEKNPSIPGILTANSTGIKKSYSQSGNEETLSTIETSNAAVTSSFLNSTMSSWGRMTAGMMGIKDEKDRVKPILRTRTFANIWGRWTASLVGIDTENKLGATPKRPKKDYNRIYEKYYAAFEYQALQAEETGVHEGDQGALANLDQKQTFLSKSLGWVSTAWGTRDKSLDHGRTKPLVPVADLTEGPSSNMTSSASDQRILDITDSGTRTVGEDITPELALELSPTLQDSLASRAESADDKDIAQEVASLDNYLEPTLEGVSEVDSGREIKMVPVEENGPESTLSPLAASPESWLGREPSPAEIVHDTEDEMAVDAPLDAATRTEFEDDVDEVICSEGLHDGNEVHQMENDDVFEYDSVAKMDEDDGSVGIEEENEEQREVDVVDLENQPESHFDVHKPGKIVRGVDPMAVMESETMNFFYRFLVARGLDVWLMATVLALEWARIYMSPFTDVFVWALSNALNSFGRPSIEKERLGRIRGGSSVDASDGEDETERVSDGDEVDVEDASLTTTDTEDHGARREISDDLPRVPVVRSRPNRFYQYLFTYGRVGHVLIMECVLLQEWVDTYLPAAGNTFRRVVAESFPSLLGPSELSRAPLSQTTGFVGADGTAVRGAKKRKAQTRKEDQKALTQLMRVGDVTTAKYRFVSEIFMKRHKIGHFASEQETVDRPKDPPVRSRRKDSHSGQIDEAESDAEWIVSALTQVEDDDANVVGGTYPGSSIEKDPAITVGFEIGMSKRPRRKGAAISNVAKIAVASELPVRKKNSRSRVSDRESGVIGRIRAAGANSLVGRSILGAYPGDVPPPSEAASPHGLFDLAEKYGYGEWSDSDDENEPESWRPKQRAKASLAEDETSPLVDLGKGNGSRRRRKKSSQKIGLEFELGTTSTQRIRSHDMISERATRTHRAAQSPAKPASVRQAGLDAIAERASKRRKEDLKTTSEAKDSGKSPLPKSQELKSGASTVVGTGLQHLKEKHGKGQEKGDSE